MDEASPTKNHADRNRERPSDRNNDRTLYEQPSRRSQTKQSENDHYESPDCCFVRTFCCCITDAKTT